MFAYTQATGHTSVHLMDVTKKFAQSTNLKSHILTHAKAKLIMLLHFFVPILLILQSHFSNGEVFTALIDMEKLVTTEFEIVRHLENYIQAEEEKLNRMRAFLKEYESMYNEAITDVTKYLANPINAYLIVKRLTADWREVENVMSENLGTAYIQNLTLQREVLHFPTDEDLSGAAVALMRLQDTYELDTHALAKGELLGKKYARQLTAGDCYELGRQSYNSGDHYHTVLWMAEAMNNYYGEKKPTISLPEILDYLSFSTFKQGNVRQALQLTNQLLKLVPYHQRALGNKQYFENIIRNEGLSRQRGETGHVGNVVPISDEPFSTSSLKLTKPSSYNAFERKNYEILCRGVKLMKPKVEARLRCRYFTNNNNPYLILGPIKEEEAYLNPRLVVYHDVISDREIETVKQLAQPRLKRATVQNSVTGELEPANYRISKSAWLKSEEDKHIDTVVKRIGVITGLDMNTAEDLQVVNYGIGGHYDPHFDYARKEEVNAFASLGTGNRIATWLFYMSDVEAGGATVFPVIDVALWPKKGSAAFWYNLIPNGEGNENTRHAACPVLSGSKWVSNKWIHERGQEFRRPCALHQDAEL